MTPRARQSHIFDCWQPTHRIDRSDLPARMRYGMGDELLADIERWIGDDIVEDDR
jgi:hypothetical protein